MGAARTKAGADVRRRPLQTAVLATVLFLATGAATLALNILDGAQAPFERAFQRANGAHLVVDFADGELEAGDVFLMVTDGVWEVLGDVRMTEILSRGTDPESIARDLVAAAHERQAAYMGRNDATAIVVCVERPVA